TTNPHLRHLKQDPILPGAFSPLRIQQSNRPTHQTQAGVVESQGTMGVPVVVHPEV
ncbi:unnamed protein product, partial [Ectocarpus sp. 13 AM-2016]